MMLFGMGSVSLIFISHDEETLRICDTVYKLDRGSLKYNLYKL